MRRARSSRYPPAIGLDVIEARGESGRRRALGVAVVRSRAQIRFAEVFEAAAEVNPLDGQLALVRHRLKPSAYTAEGAPDAP